MVDIVERLNDLYSLLDNSGSTDAIEAIMAEAAAEIQHLRAEVERLAQSRDGYAKQAAARAHECDRIRAEERERAAQIAENMVIFSREDDRDVGRPVLFREAIAAAIRASKDAGGEE